MRIPLQIPAGLERVQIILTMTLLTLLLSLLTYNLPCSAADYVMETLEGVPKNRFSMTLQKAAACARVFHPFDGVKRDHQEWSRLQSVSSYSVDENSSRDNARRGQRVTERQNSIFQALRDEFIHRILSDWQFNNGFGADEIRAIYNLHQSLPVNRLKLIWFANAEKSLFSALRIFDSSPIPKYLGIPHQIEGTAKPVKDVAERAFPSLNVDQLFSELKLKRAKQTWSLGLLDVSGQQTRAVQTLFYQAANLLDLHYNRRDFFNLRSTLPIRQDEVDLFFYCERRLVSYYHRILGLTPLTHANGDEFTLPSYNRNKDFFLFHIKGSAFIEKFLNLKYIEPLFASHRELRRYEELYENLLSTIIPAYNELNPADYKVKNFFELLHQIRRLGKAIVEQRASSDADFADKIRRLLAQILLIRRTLPDDIFSIEFNESHRHQLAHLLSAPMAPGFHQYERELLANHALLSAFYIASFFIEDPLFMFINRSALKPLQP